ncbi:class I SAM-dependent methyltransferase [Vulcaniibacterium gelatinicum]|uniref:class I SAM-dependent methyltransferase n=1 Tax=Vulcaniibacterium gelatinicum TaxID=2598725 RepID=UPI0015F2E1ED|nr:class I SAM-dependent methyltransferase [Vulcaniibacterium gelatinicum]
MSLEHWEAYYRGGALATCPTSPEGGYDLELREVWRDFFAPLPAQARLLDIGTGNGAVALIAAETAAALGRRWEIHATDLAQIDPPRHVPGGAERFSGITFHPGVATEQLPFPEAHFDAVSGQYALEYSDTARALAELARVLKPGARAQFVLHHAESRLVLTGKVSQREAELVFNELRVYRRLRKLLAGERMSADAAQRAGVEVQSAIRALKLALPQAQQSGGGRMLAVTLDAVRKLMEMRAEARPELVGLEIDRAENELRAGVRRLNDLVVHACSNERMTELEGQAATAGFEVLERVPQYHAGANLVGWRLVLRRA